MNGIIRIKVAAWLLAALSSVPVFLFAYLGQFSRLIADDYCIIATSRALNTWDALTYYYSTWTGAYTRNFLMLLLAPLDTSLASVMPLATIVLWCASLAWMVWTSLRVLINWSNSWPVLLALVFLLVSASINGMLSQQSFYWFIASLTYILSTPVLLLSLGIWIRNAFRSVPTGNVGLAAAAIFVLCFFNAGTSEMYLVFQGVFLSGLIAAVAWFLGASTRRRSLILLGAGWIGTAISAAIQVSSPGIQARAASDVSRVFNRAEPIRTLPELLIRSAEATFEVIGHQQAFAGFVIVFCAALFVTLSAYHRPMKPNSGVESTLAARALWFGLITQLLFVPILWMHWSDSQQVLGRFSIAFSFAVCINVLQIAAFALLLVFRRRVENFVRDRGLWQAYIAALLLLALMLFALTQLRSIHFRAATFLFVSSFVLLCAAWLQLRSAGIGSVDRRMVWLPLFVSGLSLICYGSMVAVSLYGQGFVVERIFVPATFIYIVSGAFWGASLGCLLQHAFLNSHSSGGWLLAYRAVSLAVVIAISVGIVIGQLRLAPRLATFAREWDERHAEIIRQRESGATEIVVPELSYDFGYELVTWHIFDTKRGSRCSATYYGVDSIIRSPGDS